MKLLRELAAASGIQLSYRDMAGRVQQASPETLRALLKLNGVATGNLRQIRDALHDQEQQHWHQFLDHSSVAWDGRATRVELRLPGKVAGEGRCQIHLETGP